MRIENFSRAEFAQVASYPALAKKFAHSCGVKRSTMRPMAPHRPSTVRSAAFRRSALSEAGLRLRQAQLGGEAGGEFEKAFSIGLKSGLLT